MLVAATWFLSRLLWDHVLRRSWRDRPERRRVRFACITITGVLVAATGFGAVIWSIYGMVAGIASAAVLVPIYCFMAVALRLLLQSFDVDVDHR